MAGTENSTLTENPIAAPDIGQPVREVRGVRSAAGTPIELYIDGDGVVTDTPTAAGCESGAVLTLPGWLVLPSAVEPHAHLDKALSWSATGAGYGDLLEAIDSWHAYTATMNPSDVTSRARRALRQYVAGGITAVRSHVDALLEPADPLDCARATIALREQLGDVLDLQLCLLVDPLVPGSVAERALDLGIDVLGGCPHRADDPVAEIGRLLDIAERRGTPVDLHTDERLDPSGATLTELADQVRARGMGGQVTASHCVSLGSLGTPELGRVLDRVRAAELSVVTLPITNLYLQGRHSAPPVPRGLTAVRDLLAAGITVAAGGDNLRDPFNPVGRADPFETTSLLITAAHLDAEQALRAVTEAGRRVMGLPAAGIQPGQLADLLLVRAGDLHEALAGPTGSRIVLRRGRVLSTTSVHQHTAID